MLSPQVSIQTEIETRTAGETPPLTELFHGVCINSNIFIISIIGTVGRMLRQTLRLTRRYAIRPTRTSVTVPPSLPVGEDPMPTIIASYYYTWSAVMASHGTSSALPAHGAERRYLSTGKEYVFLLYADRLAMYRQCTIMT